jgi:F-type H+-transporting ATPase subunit b
MGELVEKLGIEPGLLIAQIVNFAIVALVLWKFAYKPVVDMLESRRKKIEVSINEAERIEKERINLNKEIALKLDEAKKEAGRIIDEAKKTGARLSQDVYKEAEEHSEKMIQNAEKEIAAMTDTAKSEIQAETTKLVVMALEKVSKETFDAKKNEAVIEKTIKELA